MMVLRGVSSLLSSYEVVRLFYSCLLSSSSHMERDLSDAESADVETVTLKPSTSTFPCTISKRRYHFGRSVLHLSLLTSSLSV